MKEHPIPHFRFAPKDHQGVAPYQVRNPWYRAKDSAESVSPTKARTCAEEYNLKRSFPATEQADLDTNGVKMMRRCSESDIPEDIRAKLPNVVWSREEECDVSEVKQDGTVGEADAVKPEGEETMTQFEFKKRNAWEIHKSRRKRRGILESERLPLPAVKELQDAGQAPDDLPALIPIASPTPKSATPTQPCPPPLLKSPQVFTVGGRHSVPIQNGAARPQSSDDFFRKMATAGWQYYGCGGGSKGGTGGSGGGCGRCCCQKKAQSATAPSVHSWPPNYPHAAAITAATNGESKVRPWVHSAWSTQLTGGGKPNIAPAPRTASESEVNQSRLSGQGVATGASGVKNGGLNTHQSPADLQWRHQVERQQQIALWQHRLWLVKQQQLLQQQQHQQQIHRQKLMKHQEAEARNIQPSITRAGESKGDPPTYREATSSGTIANVADGSNLKKVGYSSNSLQGHSMMQWLRLKAREKVLQRQWNDDGTQNIQEFQERIFREGQYRHVQQQQNGKLHQQQQSNPQVNEHQREKQRQPHQVTQQGYGKSIARGGDTYGEKAVIPTANGTIHNGRIMDRHHEEEVEVKTTTPEVTQSKGPAEPRWNHESYASSSPSSATHIPPFISAAAMSTMRSTRRASSQQ